MSFLLVMPMVMLVFWIVLQAGLSTIAAIGAQQAASETAAVLGDQRGLRSGVCTAVTDFETLYGDVMAGSAQVAVSGSAGTRPGCTAGWNWTASSAACDGDNDGTGAVGKGVEVVVDADAIELLPALGAGLGITVVNRLHEVTASSCARVREAP